MPRTLAGEAGSWGTKEAEKGQASWRPVQGFPSWVFLPSAALPGRCRPAGWGLS